MKKIRTTNHKVTAALLVAVMMLSVIFTTVFTGGVKANATPTTHTYCYDENLLSNFFTVTGNTTERTTTINGTSYKKGLKLETSSGKIAFTPTQAGTLKVFFASATTLKINDKEVDVSNNIYEVHYTASETEVVISKGDGAGIIYKVTYTTDDDSSESSTEPTKPSTSTTYTVNVVNGTVNGETSINNLNEGASVTIKADKADNFAYWLNSSNKIISTDTSYTFNVYFSDTYTAVYNDTTSKKVVFMTVYGQEYTTVAYDNSFGESSIPAVPARYGYTDGTWDKTVEEISTALELSDYIQIKPEYKKDASVTYKVKIQDTNDKTYERETKVAANTIITVTTNKDGFTFWKDNKSGKVVSYNKTYSFYVNKDISLVAKATSATPVGMIRLVNTTTNSDGNKEIIYEYTVPDDCSIQFAGIVADADNTKVNDKDAEYKGGRASSSKTFKYTLTIHSSMINSLYVKPILKYTDAEGKLHVIDDVEASLASSIQ